LASKEGNPLYPVPKIMNSRELETIYALITEEEAAYGLYRDDIQTENIFS